MNTGIAPGQKLRVGEDAYAYYNPAVEKLRLNREAFYCTFGEKLFDETGWPVGWEKPDMAFGVNHWGLHVVRMEYAKVKKALEEAEQKKGKPGASAHREFLANVTFVLANLGILPVEPLPEPEPPISQLIREAK